MSQNQKTPLPVRGVAGCAEACAMHPLDTIKVRMQLRRNVQPKKGSAAGANTQNLGMIGTARGIIQKDGFLGLYRGLGAVVTGIVPKMAIRFLSFEWYKDLLGRDPVTGKTGFWQTFLAGLGAGTTESILVVTPMDCLKIRVQAARASMTDPAEAAKYKNLFTAARTLIKEEGFKALYKGVGFTVARQGINQAVNFTGYQYIKDFLNKSQPQYEGNLPAWQNLIAGGVSGAFGPLANQPIDTLKTRIQRTRILPGSEMEKMSGWQRGVTLFNDILKNEGWRSFYKGVTPRVLRVAPGQAITFMVYEKVKSLLMGTSIAGKKE